MADNVQPTQTGAEPVTPQPTSTEPFSIPDDAQVEVMVRGETVRMPWKQARGGIQMQEDYTRSKQDLAKQVKELNDVYEQVKTRQQTIAEKEAALDAILGRTPQSTKQKTSADLADDEVVDGKTVKELLKQQREEFGTTLNDTLTKARSEDAQARLFQRWEDLTSDTINSLKKEAPLLETIPHLDLVLKREALNDKPQTEAEMKAALVRVGQALSQKLEQAYTERRKQEVVRKTQLVEKGPTTVQGGPQFQAPKKEYGQRGKISWDELERDAIAAVEALEE